MHEYKEGDLFESLVDIPDSLTRGRVYTITRIDEYGGHWFNTDDGSNRFINKVIMDQYVKPAKPLGLCKIEEDL